MRIAQDAVGHAVTMPMLMFGFSEKFLVRLNKSGAPKNPERVDRLCALFTVNPY